MQRERDRSGSGRAPAAASRVSGVASPSRIAGVMPGNEDRCDLLRSDLLRSDRPARADSRAQ